MADTPRGVIVCGGGVRADLREPAARLAAALGWPLLADPTSGVRCGPHDRSHVVAHYDVLLRAERSPRTTGPASCCGSATCPCPSRCAPGWPRRPRWCSTPTAPGTSPRGEPSCILARGRPPPSTPWPPPSRCAARGRTQAGVGRGGTPTRSCRRRSPRPPTASSPADRRRSSRRCPTTRSSGSAHSMPIRDVEAFFPPVAQAAPLPRQPRRQRDRRRGVVGARRRPGHGGAHLAAHRRVALLHDVGGLLAARRPARDLHDRLREQRRRRRSSTSSRWPSTPTRGLRAPHRHPTGGAVEALAGPGLRVRADRPRHERQLHRALVERVAERRRQRGHARGAGAPRGGRPLGHGRRVARAPLRRLDERRAAAAQARVALVLEQLRRGHEAGRRRVGRGAGRVRLLAARRLAVERLDRAERRCCAPRRSGPGTSWRAPRAAGVVRRWSERESMIADCGR